MTGILSGKPLDPSLLKPDCDTATRVVPNFAHYRPNHVSTKGKNNLVDGLSGPIKKNFSPIVARPPVDWHVPQWKIVSALIFCRQSIPRIA